MFRVFCFLRSLTTEHDSGISHESKHQTMHSAALKHVCWAKHFQSKHILFYNGNDIRVWFWSLLIQLLNAAGWDFGVLESCPQKLGLGSLSWNVLDQYQRCMEVSTKCSSSFLKVFESFVSKKLNRTSTNRNQKETNTPWKINGWNLQITHERKENDLNQTSMRTCSMLIFRGVNLLKLEFLDISSFICSLIATQKPCWRRTWNKGATEHGDVGCFNQVALMHSSFLLWKSQGWNSFGLSHLYLQDPWNTS